MKKKKRARLGVDGFCKLEQVSKPSRNGSAAQVRACKVKPKHTSLLFIFKLIGHITCHPP